MANNLTTEGQNAVNDWVAETHAKYLALLDTGGTELTGGSYARVDASAKWGASAAGTKANDTVIEFPTATGDWSEAVSAALYVASTGGNPQTTVTLTTARTVLTGDFARYGIGTVTLVAPA